MIIVNSIMKLLITIKYTYLINKPNSLNLNIHEYIYF